MAIPAAPFVAGVLAGGLAGTAYGAIMDGCALDDIQDLSDTMASNPDLNFPAWMNDLADWYNEAATTPDPILTLRRIGAWGRSTARFDVNGDGFEKQALSPNYLDLYQKQTRSTQPRNASNGRSQNRATTDFRILANAIIALSRLRV